MLTELELKPFEADLEFPDANKSPAVSDLSGRHIQQVMYMDIYQSDGLVGDPRTGIRITEPRPGLSTQPHGAGIRILYDREQTTGAEARELILAFAKFYKKRLKGKK